MTEGAHVRFVDLNADVGEEVGPGVDEGLMAAVTSANVACGFHAGSPATMREACALAVAHGVSVGAQVSYHDREGFGRRRLEVAPAVLARQVEAQVGLLAEIAKAEGTAVRYVRPHGALYNRIVDDEEQAAAVLAGSGELAVLGLPDSAVLRLAERAGRVVRTEAFPDRAYTADGRLVPRSDPSAVLTDAALIAARAVDLAARVDSLCVHGDNPGAVEHARAVRRALEAAGWQLRGL